MPIASTAKEVRLGNPENDPVGVDQDLHRFEIDSEVRPVAMCLFSLSFRDSDESDPNLSLKRNTALSL